MRNLLDATAAAGVLTRGSRPSSMTYPNGRALTYHYNGATLDEAIGRLTSIVDSTATLESYAYLGTGTIVRRSHPEPDLNLSLIKRAGEADGDGADQYAGLDRFGRVADQR